MCTRIAADQDISGLGIRVSFYVSILLTAVTPVIPGVKDDSELDSALSDDGLFQRYEVIKAESLSTISSNARISSLAILITTVIKTFQHQLSLYHAIFLFHLMFFLTVVHVGLPPPRESDHLIKRVLASIIAYGSTWLFCAWAIYMWVKVPMFGVDPACNVELQYISIFGFRSSGGIEVRAFWVGICILLTVVMVLLFIKTCRAQISRKQKKAVQNLRATWRTSWVIRLALGIFGIVMLENYIKHNNHLLSESEENWSFGQILALVMTYSSVAAVFRYIVIWGKAVNRRGIRSYLLGYIPRRIHQYWTVPEDEFYPDLQMQ